MKTLFMTLIVYLTLISCSDDGDTYVSSVCNRQAFINSDLFENSAPDDVTINTFILDKDCLTIQFSSSGCDGSTWEYEIIDSGDIIETSPPQRNLKLAFSNNEDCSAAIKIQNTFNIQNLQVDGNQVLLNFVNTGDQFLYDY